MGAQIVSSMTNQECPVCGAKPGDTRYDIASRMIIVGKGVEIVLNKQGDYIARKKDDE